MLAHVHETLIGTGISTEQPMKRWMGANKTNVRNERPSEVGVGTGIGTGIGIAMGTGDDVHI